MKVQFHKGSLDTRITTPQLFENLEVTAISLPSSSSIFWPAGCQGFVWVMFAERPKFQDIFLKSDPNCIR